MKPHRGKVIAVSAGLLGIAVLATAGFALKDRVREEYWLWKLDSTEDRERRLAAGKVADMQSVRAIPLLLTHLREDSRLLTFYQGSIAVPIGRYTYGVALAKIGSPAVAGLIDALRDNDVRIRVLGAMTLGRMGKEAEDAVPTLIDARQSANYDERKVIDIDAALKSIAGERWQG